MSENKIISGKEFSQAICKALGLEINRVRRIVLDISKDSLIVAYVEMIGDSRFLEISIESGIDAKITNVQDAKP